MANAKVLDPRLLSNLMANDGEQTVIDDGAASTTHNLTGNERVVAVYLPENTFTTTVNLPTPQEVIGQEFIVYALVNDLGEMDVTVAGTSVVSGPLTDAGDCVWLKSVGPKFVGMEVVGGTPAVIAS